MQTIYNKIDQVRESLEYRVKYAKRKHMVFYVLTPTHVNLGDHAITEAVEKILSDLRINFFEISDAQLMSLYKSDKLKLMNGATILINGGGNLGTLWFELEKVTRAIIEQNPKSNIVILPNTIYYENSEWGQSELKKSIDIYNAHKKLKIFAREKISYDYMKKIYNDVDLVPDMVLSLNKCENQATRKGCLICLRADIEGTLCDEAKQYITEQMKSLFDCIKITDMYAEGVEKVNSEERVSELEKKYNEFKGAELVVTDRLHGMIFSAITGTPCIVVNSLSPKVKGCYEWIKDLEYIHFCDDISKIKDIYYSMPKHKFDYNNNDLLLYYNKLKEELKKVCQK